MIKAFDDNHVSTSLDVYKVALELRRQLIDILYLPYVRKLLQKEELLGSLGFGTKAFRSTRDYSKIDRRHRSDKTIEQRVNDGELIKIRSPKK
jgi:hypothetical protein